ncbi:MAG: glutamate synthase large subunit [Candidatus Hydrogenedentes bacterium]|nr:glutamate synthase large subunit [Candidatus Hydrogenedentota bacterium]MDY0030768.1 glutamate synthase large subunit [FCB group bacterium]NLT60245.1 glutamate synthase large subunit [Candidatus Hydrogenedentota bacterium]HNZ17037.1 glutamate synthase large subunit [Candidatus Hydrogenedentota bacterium]HOH32751.1 glutamate synthase large subunit [Candidatus Hydrogenedentota bacterium]
MHSISHDGMYQPFYEHDACGIGFVVNLKGTASHAIVRQGIQVLENLVHRGACGCDPETGDGAGMLVRLPHRFFQEESARLKFDLPAAGAYAVGMVFLPKPDADRAACREIVEQAIADEGHTFLAWREVPCDSSAIGPLARSNEPRIEQVFLKGGDGLSDGDAFERRLYVLRRVIERRVRAAQLEHGGQFYIPSLSARTIVYKGLMLADQMSHYYPDLSEPAFESYLALVHQRYSTNTLPTWPLAQPFRYLCHNGEINTLRGNINMMHSREHHLESPLFGDDIAKLPPIHTLGASDSAILDNSFELLMQGGRSGPHAMMMLIPEPWSGHESMPDYKRAFYEYHACMQEPWDGPASIAFTDGTRIGAVLDRNGLRPSRYWVTKDDFVVLASEVGVLDVPEEKIVKKGRLEPGRMFYIDTAEHRIIDDDELKETICKAHPYRDWLNTHRVVLPGRLEAKTSSGTRAEAPLLERQQVFGYSQEDIDVLLKPMALTAHEPVGSMGNDAPLAVLSSRPQLLFNYFKQLFAQVTNPPIDPIREEIVMSLEMDIGRERNLLGTTPEHCRRLHLSSPIITNEQLAYIKQLDQADLRAATISTLFPAQGGPAAMEAAVDRICADASEAIRGGATLLVLSDRGVNAEFVPIPSLLATGAVHQHLVREMSRSECGLIVETGEAREVMHFCLLTGYGAGAVNPYLAFETLNALAAEGQLAEAAPGDACANFIKAVEKGMLKTMSKIGISTQHSYHSAQIFEAVGLSSALVERCFAGTATRIEGIGMAEVGRETLMRHALAYPEHPARPRTLDPGGVYKWRRRGEYHQINPDTIARIQHATRGNSREKYREFAALVNDRTRTLAALRGLLKFKKGNPVPLDEVEPAKAIVKRFCTGAMSFGSISREAHETLAIAMNRIGGRSNTGEGGEDPARFERDPNGDWRRSAIKQVASGRFGVTNEYLVNAAELQIKMAQGAKPGEGGQLPGHKVFDEIARIRYSTPGVELISPPPHHDIYSIEDLAQLIHDLKNANVHANVSVKLVSEVGVGTVAAGVSKGKADLVLVSGDVGGTGASPLSSIKHAGLPWELGLAEAQQVLVENNLRSRIRVQTDGQLKTGRDVAIAFLLGADEVGFATVPLITMGCIMMRKCHLNTCPVGVATQDPELRKKFTGKPEYVINYFFFVAEEVREIMAELGFRTVNEMIGHAEMLEYDPLPDHWKARTLDLSRVLYRARPWDGETLHHSKTQDHGIERALDHELIEQARPALENKQPVRFAVNIRNVHRTVGTMLSSELTRKHNVGLNTGYLPEDLVWIDCNGVAGQSFGAFAIQGVTLNVTGEANDYCGKGLSGGKIIVTPPANAVIVPEENIVVGNVALYGATGGKAFFRGVAGERFCVRNSGAWAVVEGVGDHGCEYMTGGRAVILGRTGRNFAAGMSGGIAFVYDPDGTFARRCNRDMVDLKPLHDKSLPELRGLLEDHFEYTGSTVARAILDQWDEAREQFVRVMPRDYARVLKQTEAKERVAGGPVS